jgi:hopanoid biosynthesis associated protein HpnK
MEVIFIADDFGRSSGINRAVLRAHRDGVLTSASLMVTGDAAGEAVALARDAPDLAVGLHLVLSDARPALSPGEIPTLVRGGDRFPANPARVWIQYIFSSAARAEMVRELRAQFECFAATGLPLDHVNAHQHLHMHPAVFAAILPLARQYGASGVRLPRVDFGLALRYDRSDAPLKALWAVVFGLLCRRYARALGRPPGAETCRSGEPVAAHGLAVTDRVYGLMQSGRMEETYVLRVLMGAPSSSLAQPVILSGPAPRDSWRRRLSEESRVAGAEDSSLVARRRESWLADPLRVTPSGRSGIVAGSSPSVRPVRGAARPWCVEFYFHPTLAAESEPLGANPGDLATLLSPAVRHALEVHGWVPASYATL